MNSTSLWGSFALAGPLLLCVACQSSRIAQVEQSHPLAPFGAAVVETFDASATRWEGDHGAHTPAEVVSALREEIRTRLAKGGVALADAPGAGTVVVRGAIDLVDAGSGTTRALIGLGAGQSKLTCRVWIVETGASAPTVTLSIVGGSRGSGGFFSSGYVTIADAKDAGEQIAAFLLKSRGP